MLRATTIALLTAVCGQAAAQTCQPQWSTDFAVMGMDPAPYDLVFFDADGAGPEPGAFYVGSGAGVLRWEGAHWTPVGAIQGPVARLVVFDDDGEGPNPAALYAGGSFVAPGKYVVKWSGLEWLPLQDGPLGQQVPNCGNTRLGSLEVLDPDGPGPAAASLYAGLSLEQWCMFNTSAGFVSRWDGGQWHAESSAGISSYQDAMAMWDPDGLGPAQARLHAAGSYYYTAHSQHDQGAALHTHASGSSQTLLMTSGGAFNALTAFDPDGPGPQNARLVMAGAFPSLGATPALNIGQFNGSAWSPLGQGLAGGSVTSLALFQPPGAAFPHLYAAGSFTMADGGAAARIAGWNGSSWSPLGAGIVNGVVHRLKVLDDGGGPALYALGPIALAGSQPAQGIARWHGANWSPAGRGLNNEVHALAVYGEGAQRRLYAGGQFITAGGVPAVGIASWDGEGWGAVGTGANHHVDAMAVFDDGNGPALYAGGKFSQMGGVPASRVAKWDGSSWAALDAGVNGPVNAIAAFGGALYVAGSFTSAGGVAASNIAVWRNGQWSALGAGVNGPVYALAVHGGRLHVGGQFTQAGTFSSGNLASWSGKGWAPHGPQTDWPPDTVEALASFDDGSGPALYVGGRFNGLGAFPQGGHLLKWTGHWQTLGGGVNGDVRSLTVFDRDGSGPGAPALHVGGSFTMAGATPAANLAAWSGQGWSQIAGGTSGPVLALAAAEFQGRPTLFPGGQFTQAGGVSSPRIAAWVGCEGCYANCDSSWAAPALNVADFTCFLNAFAAGDAYANCDASTAAPTLNVADFTCFLNRFAAGCE